MCEPRPRRQTARRAHRRRARHFPRRRAKGTCPATGNVTTIRPAALALCVSVFFLCLTDHVRIGFLPHHCLRGVQTAMARVKRTRADVDGGSCFAVSVCSSLSGIPCLFTTCHICWPGGTGARVLSLCATPLTFPGMEGFSNAYGHCHLPVWPWFELLSSRSAFLFIRLVSFLSLTVSQQSWLRLWRQPRAYLRRHPPLPPTAPRHLRRGSGSDRRATPPAPSTRSKIGISPTGMSA